LEKPLKRTIGFLGEIFMSDKNLRDIKDEILSALTHPEAEEGLYFRNFTLLHEEDERPRVNGDQIEILDALHELMAEGKVKMSDSGDEAIFSLNNTH